MAILHYKITSADQNIQLSTDIHAQSFLLRRVIVQQVPLRKLSQAAVAGASTAEVYTASVNKGGVVIQPSHLSGLEIVSGNLSNSNDIIVAYDEEVASHSIFYDMEFESETVPRAFNVKVKKFDKSADAVFGTQEGQITSIDLFFQFNSLFNYEGY